MTHNNFLSPTQADVLQSVTLFRQLTTSQLRRLHYQGSYNGQRVRSRRHLARLTKLGYVKRMWGAYDSGIEYVYQVPQVTARTPEPHTLDISELYVRLIEAGSKPTFYPEPWSHTKVGHVQLKPDAFVEVGGSAYFVEIDRSVEHEAQLTAKMRRYVQAIDSGRWPDDKAFPLVLWTVPDPARLRYVEAVIHKLGERELFDVCLFNDAPYRITNVPILDHQR